MNTIKKFTVLLLVLFISGYASAQVATLFKSNQERGDDFFNEFAYQEAIEEYKVAMKKAPNPALVLKIAESYRKLNDPANSVLWYAKAVEGEVVDPATYLHYAEALSSLERYDEAKIWYEKYSSASGEADRPEQKIEAIENLTLYQDRSDEIVTTRVSFNSEASDFSPEFYESDQLVFVSSRASGDAKSEVYKWDNSEYLNLYLTGADSTVKLFHPEINTKYHEGPLSIYANNSKMIFTRNNFHNNLLGANKDGVTKLKLYTSFRNSVGEWSKPQEFKYNNSEYSIGHPTVTEDGGVLVFVSDMPGGFGGTDLYRCEWANGEWSSPVNLGDKVNTKGNELFPYIMDDLHLYFSSDGHGGFGGLDLFGVDLSKEFQVINLGKPFNSSYDDFALIARGEEGYFSSNREGGRNNDDIYAFKAKSTLIQSYTIKIAVRDGETATPVSAVALTLKDAAGKIVAEATTDDSGEYSFSMPLKNQYHLYAKKENYQDDSIAVNFADSTFLSQLSLNLKRNEASPVTDTLEVRDSPDSALVKTIYFDFAQVRLRQDAQKVLAEVVNFMKANRRTVVEINSHADSRGNEQFNQQLSNRRFKAAVKYLVAQGIEISRIKGEGNGEKQLVNRCSDDVPCTEEEHQLNRRTELLITEQK